MILFADKWFMTTSVSKNPFINDSWRRRGRGDRKGSRSASRPAASEGLGRRQLPTWAGGGAFGCIRNRENARFFWGWCSLDRCIILYSYLFVPSNLHPYFSRGPRPRVQQPYWHFNSTRFHTIVLWFWCTPRFERCENLQELRKGGEEPRLVKLLRIDGRLWMECRSHRLFNAVMICHLIHNNPFAGFCFALLRPRQGNLPLPSSLLAMGSRESSRSSNLRTSFAPNFGSEEQSCFDASMSCNF